MKKLSFYVLMGFVAGILSLPLEGVSNNQPSTQNVQSASKTGTSSGHHHDDVDDDDEDEYDILERDEIDDTDTLAIPFDDSEVEDEEQIDLDEKKDVFHLPHSR